MQNVARLRKAKGLSQTELADMISANQATISKIEKGLGNPTLSMIRKIAEALECSEVDLFADGELQHRLLQAFKAADSDRQEAVVTVVEGLTSHK